MHVQPPGRQGHIFTRVELSFGHQVAPSHIKLVVYTFMLSEKMLSTPSAISAYFSSSWENSFFCRCPSCSRVSIFSPLIQMEKGWVRFNTSSSCRREENQMSH